MNCLELDRLLYPYLDGELLPDEKLELLRQNAVLFESVPSWQRDGVGVYVSRDPQAGAQLVVDLALPGEDTYAAYLARLVA